MIKEVLKGCENRSKLNIHTPFGNFWGYRQAGRELGISFNTVKWRCLDPRQEWQDWSVFDTKTGQQFFKIHHMEEEIEITSTKLNKGI